MTLPASTRRDAATLSARLPSLVIAARRVAQTVRHGVHGRRRAGSGETFWQFRPFLSGEPSSRVDWRRSARERLGLSQRRLALRAGTTQAAISRIEGGIVSPTYATLRELMLAMGEEPVLGKELDRARAQLAREARPSSPDDRLRTGRGGDPAGESPVDQPRQHPQGHRGSEPPHAALPQPGSRRKDDAQQVQLRGARGGTAYVAVPPCG